jgi:hypothetical protein
MDPYLEGDLWTSVHTDLCVQIAHQLAPKLRPKYIALSTRRVVLALPDDESDGLTELPVPDVGILSTRPTGGPATAAAVASKPLVVRTAFPEPIPHVSIEIRDLAQRRLVTCIEVLSPTNKRGSGREEYEAKRLQICSGATNLVEIDLLRAGTRFPSRDPLPPAPYFTFIVRAEGPSHAEVWPIELEEPLPSVPVPLLEGDAEVTLDLQKALSVIYEIIGYDEVIDYSKPPPGPLTEQQAVWIDERLRNTGRRK